MSKSASSLEEENNLLRDRLRKMIKIEFRRGDSRPNSSFDGTNLAHGIRSPALLVSNNQTIASFSTIRFSMDDDYNLSVEDVVKKVKIPIVKGFDFLKIIRSNSEYRLSLCNQRGNQFFDHKKYDKFYSMIPNSMKYIRTSSIHPHNDEEINWLDMHTRCGFMACFQLKPGSTEYAPEVISVKSKTKIGSLSPIVGYYDFMDLALSSGEEVVKFSSPFLDRDRENKFFVRETNSVDKKKFSFDLNLLEIPDRSKFKQQIKTVFP